MENLLELLKKYNMSNEDVASITGSPLVTTQQINNEMNMGVSQGMGTQNQTLLGSDQQTNKTLGLMGLLGSPEALMGLSLLGAGSRGEKIGQAALPSFIEGLKGASLVNEFGKIQKQQEFAKNLPEGIYKTVGALYPEIAAKAMVEEEANKPKIKAELLKQQNEYSQNLQKTYISHPDVKDFNQSQNQINKLISGIKQDSAAGDLSAIFTYMKVLDPTSVVREGEQATAANARGIPDAVRNTYNNLMTGERLTPKQRDDFTNTAIKLFSNNQQSIDSLKNNINQTILPRGIDPKDVFIDSDVRPKQIKVGENIVNVPTGTRLIGFDMEKDQYVYQTPGKNGFQFKVKRQVE